MKLFPLILISIALPGILCSPAEPEIIHPDYLEDDKVTKTITIENRQTHDKQYACTQDCESKNDYENDLDSSHKMHERLLATYEGFQSVTLTNIKGYNSITKTLASKACFRGTVHLPTDYIEQVLPDFDIITKSIYEDDVYGNVMQESDIYMKVIQNYVNSFDNEDREYLRYQEYCHYKRVFEKIRFTDITLNSVGTTELNTGDPNNFLEQCGDYFLSEFDLKVSIQFNYYLIFNEFLDLSYNPSFLVNEPNLNICSIYKTPTPGLMFNSSDFEKNYINIYELILNGDQQLSKTDSGGTVTDLLSLANNDFTSFLRKFDSISGSSLTDLLPNVDDLSLVRDYGIAYNVKLTGNPYFYKNLVIGEVDQAERKMDINLDHFYKKLRKVVNHMKFFGDLIKLVLGSSDTFGCYKLLYKFDYPKANFKAYRELLIKEVNFLTASIKSCYSMDQTTCAANIDTSNSVQYLYNVNSSKIMGDICESSLYNYINIAPTSQKKIAELKVFTTPEKQCLNIQTKLTEFFCPSFSDSLKIVLFNLIVLYIFIFS